MISDFHEDPFWFLDVLAVFNSIPGTVLYYYYWYGTSSTLLATFTCNTRTLPTHRKDTLAQRDRRQNEVKAASQ